MINLRTAKALGVIVPPTLLTRAEQHLRRILLSYMKYYNEVRTHLSLEKDTPVSRAVERTGHILCRPVLGGLHHQYIRI